MEKQKELSLYKIDRVRVCEDGEEENEKRPLMLRYEFGSISLLQTDVTEV